MQPANTSHQSPNLEYFPLLTCVLLFALALFLGMQQITPPPVVLTNAPADQFSAERASEYLNHIAVRPHMVGSQEHAKVQAYISKELQLLGLQTQLQATSVIYDYPRYSKRTPRIAKVKNIVARLPGKNPDYPAVTLMSHYDSVPTAAGAGDAGSGVAAILETLRVLRNGPQLLRDVIVVITDAEEVGLLGAQGFFREHPWAQEIGLVLNFEARGSAGGSQMFETSPGNAWLIREFRKAAKSPSASSISYEVYKRMPNDTDVSIIKDRGYQILNFAFVDNAFDYHSPADTIENLSIGSLQHHGVLATSLVQHFANLDNWQTSQSDATYFNVLPGLLVQYSSNTAIAFAVLVLLFALYTLCTGVRLKHVNPKGILAGVLSILVVIIVINVITKFAFDSFQSSERPKNLTYKYHYLLLSYGLFLVALTAAFCKFANRWVSHKNLVAAAWVILSICSAIVVFSIPNANYIFSWALLFILIGQLMVWRTKYTFWPMAIASLFCVYLWAHLLYMVYLGVGLLDPAFFSPLVLLIIVQLMCILLRIPRKVIYPFGAAVLGIALYGAFTAEYTPRKPRPTEVFYYHDAENNQSYWASRGDHQDAWTREFFPADNTRKKTVLMPFGASNLKLSSAPSVDIKHAKVSLKKRIRLGERMRFEIEIQGQT
ncbi:MAG: M28 family peptidase, partial [Gammaproteobacteria bacterium]|nr:M28 family peptidase [Gammaproteobacteria bacterium]